MYTTGQDIALLAKPLFERMYQIGVRMKDTLSIEELRTFGLPTSGNKLLDRQMHMELVDRYAKISDMVEYFKEDIPFSLRNRNDSKEIFDLIDKYLRGWLSYVQDAVNLLPVPLEDLVMLDKLAAQFYQYALEGTTGTLSRANPFERFSKGAFLGSMFAEKSTTALAGMPDNQTSVYPSVMQELSQALHARQNRK